MDIEIEVRGAHLSWFHYRLALVLGTVLLIDGYDLFNAGYIAPYLRKEWGLSDAQTGVMLSIGIAGLALGAFLQAPVARKVGRRGAVSIAVFILAGASLAMATLVQQFHHYLAMRLVLGISLGMLSPLAFVYVNEWAPKHSANRFATIAFVLPFSLGGIAAGLSAITLGPALGWRGLYLLAVVGFPVAGAAFMLLPESLVRLVEQRRLPEIRDYLSAIRPDRAAVYDACDRFTLPEPSAGRTDLGALFAPRYRTTTLGIWLASSLSLLSLHGLTGWLPTILVARGQAFSSAFGFGTLLMSMQILGGACGGVLADRHGRALVMVWGFAGSAMALVALQAANGSLGTALAVAAAGFCIFGTQAIMNNFTAQAYEPALRGLGTGSAVAFSRLGGVLGPLVIAATRAVDASLWTTFATLALSQLLAGGIVYGVNRKAPRAMQEENRA